MTERRFRYGPWRGGGDPLHPPYDVRAAADQLGRDVLAGSSPREALRDMLRRGLDSTGDDAARSGLDDLLDRARRRREELQRRGGDVSRTLDQVRQILDQALAAERDTLGREDSDDARLRELALDELPRETAGAVRELENYDWRSAEGAEAYAEINRLLRRELLDAQFAGMRDALRTQGAGDGEANQAVRDMLADLNALLAKHARGEDTEAAFAEFMRKHGHLFPENPRTVDELIDALAGRAAATERLMRSLRPEQRQELEQLMDQASQNPDLGLQLAALRDNLRTLRPGMDWNPASTAGGAEPMGYGDSVEALSELADVEALIEQLGQDYPGASLDDIDVEALERQLGSGAANAAHAVRDLERELERQGYLDRDRGGLTLTPKAVRRLGETALRRVFDRLQAMDRGDHDDRRTGAADEPTGASRAWRFGDEHPLDVVRTVSNAVLRTAESGGSPTRSAHSAGTTLGGADGTGGIALQVEDFEIAETERRSAAAVALCVDLSYSMVQEGRWGPMKQTALALSHLIETRYQQDALQIIGFHRVAHRLNPTQLAGVEPEWIQGTNLQHALALAGRHLRRHPDAEPVVLVVTDGEPTAHLESDGSPVFSWPTTYETLHATITEIDALTRYGATLNLFMLGDDPGLARFVDAVARRNGGRVLTPGLDRLGDYVVADYLKARRGRR